MTAETVAMYISGPASAVVVMLLFFYALYQLTSKQLIPLAAKALDRHLQALDALVTSQREDHSKMIESLARIEEHCSHLTTDHGVSSANGLQQ